MGTRFTPGRWVVLLAAAGLLLSGPGVAQAHPQLAGQWVSPTPPGGFAVYEFGPGYLLGRGIWRGRYTYNVSNCAVLTGVYELRMFGNHQGTLATRDDRHAIGSAVGIVDLMRQTLDLGGVTYRHRPPVAAPILVPSPAP